MGKYIISDTTLRDGEQMPGVVFSREQKVELARLSDRFGCHIIKTMPAISEAEAATVKEIAGLGLRAEVSAMTMLKREHVDIAARCGVQRVMLFTSVSGIHMEKKLKVGKEENIAKSLEMIDYAKRYGMKIDFGVEDATRADMSYLIRFIRSVEKDIELFFPADTLGRLTPFQTFAFVQSLVMNVRPGIMLHAHNDFGMATANVMAGLAAGAKGFSATFCGIGERAGNAPMEEVCAALKFLAGEDPGVRLDMLPEICGKVESYARIPLQKHKPIIGGNAFTHESGIHVDGMLKDTRTYENFDPALVGRERRFLFGKHSGRSGIRHAIGGGAGDQELSALLDKVKSASLSERKSFTAEQVRFMFNATGVLERT